jgi:hypothetical protein
LLAVANVAVSAVLGAVSAVLGAVSAVLGAARVAITAHTVIAVSIVILWVSERCICLTTLSLIGRRNHLAVAVAIDHVRRPCLSCQRRGCGEAWVVDLRGRI